MSMNSWHILHCHCARAANEDRFSGGFGGRRHVISEEWRLGISRSSRSCPLLFRSKISKRLAFSCASGWGKIGMLRGIWPLHILKFDVEKINAVLFFARPNEN